MSFVEAVPLGPSLITTAITGPVTMIYAKIIPAKIANHSQDNKVEALITARKGGGRAREPARIHGVHFPANPAPIVSRPQRR